MKAPIVKLGCNDSCNHVFFTVKHGKHVAAKGSTWTHPGDASHEWSYG